MLLANTERRRATRRDAKPLFANSVSLKAFCRPLSAGFWPAFLLAVRYAKNLRPPPAPAASCVAQIAADRRVHQAFQWLHLQEQRILEGQGGMAAAARPPCWARP